MKFGKLGRLPQRTDPRFRELEFKLARYVPKAPKAPATCDWTGGIKSFGMMANDRIGDCAVAAPGHMIQCWTKCESGRKKTISDKAIIKAYSAISGYVPGYPQTDIGCYISDVLNYWRKTGIGGDKIEAYASVNVHDHAMVRWAAWKFGGGDIGLNMPLAWQTRDVWDYKANDHRYDPGTWGGHSVCPEAYNSDGLLVVTWGTLKLLTWTALDVYCDEWRAVLNPDWYMKDGKCPAGFDRKRLLSDLASLPKGRA